MSYKDRLGLPRPRIDYRLSDYTRQGFKKAREVNSAIYKALGATEYTTTNKDDPTYFEVDGEGFNYFGAGHIMGTTLMGFVEGRLRRRCHIEDLGPRQPLHRRQRDLSGDRNRPTRR